MENEVLEASYLYYICNSKAIKIYPKQHAYFHRILFTEDALKIRTSFQVTFLRVFFDKSFFLTLRKLAKFQYQAVFTS